MTYCCVASTYLSFQLNLYLILVIADGDWTFLEHIGLYYRFFEAYQTWTDANCSCVASAPPGYTGNLASVHNSTTNTFVANLTGSQNAWLGGYQNSSGAEEPSGGWRWSDGSAWDYENWFSGEPNNLGGKEDYLDINFGEKGKWNDEDTALGGYVCQYKG